MVMRFQIEAEPDRNGYALVEKPPKRYDVGLWAQYPGVLQLRFTTGGPERKRAFQAFIYDFGALAKEMMEANPEAAIKAFGAAMQELPLTSKLTAPVARQNADANGEHQAAL